MAIAITITGKDRSGIIAALTGAIMKAKGNLEDASMTVLEGEFAMIFLATLKSKSSRGVLDRELATLKRKFGLEIGVKEIKRKLKRGEKHRSGTDPWVVSVLGKDRAGIVHGVCRELARLGLNITDLNSRILGTGQQASYALVLEVDVPRSGSGLARMKKSLEVLQSKLRVSITFHPVETAYI